jgi:type IV secretory pathway TrbD component
MRVLLVFAGYRPHVCRATGLHDVMFAGQPAFIIMLSGLHGGVTSLLLFLW